MCDPLSAFGGIVAVNSVISKKLALELNKNFFRSNIIPWIQKRCFENF